MIITRIFTVDKKMRRHLNKFLAAVAAILMLSGCAVNKVIQDVEQDIQTVKQGPKELPERNITDFADGLRCMDNLFAVFGYAPNEYVILMEDLKDETKKVDAGAKDMFISAVSDMNRRSQVIQLIAYGAGSGNLISFLAQAEQKGVYQNIPPYDIIGSVTQLDKDVVRKQADLAGQAGGTVSGETVGGGFGLSASNNASVLGLDLSVVTTHNIAVIPGVTTRNSVVIYKTGTAKEFDAGISKTGVNFSIAANTSDGTSQALRALVELSAIELMGKLLKIPYWKCLGLDSEHDVIQREISDWHYQLTQNQQINTLIKVQLYLRGYYSGPFDESVTSEYNDAIIAYKARLGLPQKPGVDLVFYSSFLNEAPDAVALSELAYIRQNREKEEAEREKEIKKQQNTVRHQGDNANPDPEPVLEVKAEPLPPIEQPLSLEIGSASVTDVFKQGEEIFLSIKSNTNGYVNCYLESGGSFFRIFPNRFSADGFIASKGLIPLPDSPAYSVTADADGEKIHCMLTTRIVQTDLPSSLRLPDFEALPISSKAEISQAYRQVTSGRFSEATYTIRVE